MSSNYFGKYFRITTFGESHGPCIGVVIDGCPPGLALSAQDIDTELAFRRPGRTPHTSPRQEEDTVEILSGLFEGQTTGAPIALLIRNRDADPSQYETIKEIYRPGHANFTYLKKYGVFDHRGGGRASARETAARVAAGAIAKKILAQHQIHCVAFISEMGGIVTPQQDYTDLNTLRSKTHTSPLFCPDVPTTEHMIHQLNQVKEEGDSLGGIVTCVAHVPAGLGDPVYEKIEALLAFAILSIPATKGFEIGAGFEAARMRGSEHNDSFVLNDKGETETATNHSGGTLGGISTGAPLFFRVAFKPTSSIKKQQQTVTLQGKETIFQLPPSGRHDPCVAIRGVPVVEAMTALVLVDALLKNKNNKN